ncbi:MAG: methionine--tRNA ligase subunit beta [Nanoarchaeota archaeon]|nr:methionine--tRNA ligase subunit beta [Nanoarchaeota archaeon]
MEISYDHFARLDLRIGTITAAEPVEHADKLLRLDVEIGEETRHLIAGIADTYNPVDLVGRQIVVVTNLAPKTIRGIESNGMLLAADVNGEPVLLRPDQEVPSGAKVH